MVCIYHLLKVSFFSDFITMKKAKKGNLNGPTRQITDRGRKKIHVYLARKGLREQEGYELCTSRIDSEFSTPISSSAPQYDTRTLKFSYQMKCTTTFHCVRFKQLLPLPHIIHHCLTIRKHTAASKNTCGPA